MDSLDSGLPSDIEDAEDVARFVRHRSHVNERGAKWQVFEPARDGAASVFRHGAEPRQGLKDLFTAHVQGEQLPEYLGAAILKVLAVRAVGLLVEASEPPPRHANITGWVWHDGILDKPRNKETSIVLASEASLVRP